MGDETDLQLRFGADTAGVASGVAAVKGEVESLNPVVEHLEEQFKNVAERVVEAFAVREIAEFASHLLEIGEQLERTAAMTGLSVEGVQTLGFALEHTGGSADAAGGLITRFERQVEQAAGGSGRAYEAFQKLGVSLHDIQTLPIDDLIQKTAEGFRGVSDAVERAALATAVGGRGFADLLPVFLESANGLEEYKARLTELNDNLSGNTVRALAQTKGGFVDLGRAFEGAGVQALLLFKNEIDAVTADLAAAVVVVGEGIEKFGELQTVVGEGVVLAFGRLREVAEVVAAGLSAAAQAVAARWQEVGRIIRDVATGSFSDIATAEAVAQGQIDQLNRNLNAGLTISAGKYKDLKTAADAARESIINAYKGGKESGDGPARRTGLGGGGKDDNADESVALADIAADEAIAKQRLQQQKDLYQELATLNLVSKQQAVQADKDAAESEYQIELDALNRKLALYDADEAEYAKTQDQIEVLAAKHATDMAKLDLRQAEASQKAAQASQKAYESFFNTVDKSMDTMLAGVLQGTQTWQQAMTKLFDNLALAFIEDVSKMALRWAAFEASSAAFGSASPLTQGIGSALPAALGGTQNSANNAALSANTAALTSLLSALGVHTGATLTAAQADALCTVSTDANTLSTNANSLSSDLNAASTNTNTASSVLSVGENTVATLANTVATEAEAIGHFIGSFDVGTSSVPQTGLAMIHQGEIILPPDISAQVRSGQTTIGAQGAFGGGYGGGGDVYNVTITATDAQSVTNLLKNNSGVIAQIVSGQIRNANGSLAGMRN